MASLKSTPTWLKLLIMVLVLAGIYDFSTRSRRPGNNAGTGRTAFDQPERSEDEPPALRPSPSDRSAEASQQLAGFQAQQAQLMDQVRLCEQQMTQATQQMAAGAVNGVMVNNRPPCEQNMPQWVAQEAYLETETYRLQTGDQKSSLRSITGIAAGSTAPDSYRGGRTPSDDGTGAVDNFDRQAIRGNSLYKDESGQERELPTRDYYYRDRSSGQIVGSDAANPPNDGRDYEQLESSDPR